MQASMILLHTLKASSEEVARLSFSPDGKLLAACDDRMITLWDIATGSLQSTIEDQDDMFFDMAFSHDSRWIAAASDDGHGRIWSTATGESRQTVSVDDERMLSLAFSPDSKTIATGSEVLRVWDVDTGELQHTLLGPGDHSLSFTTVHEGHEYPSEISQVLFSPDGRMLVSTSPNTHLVRLWNTETWKLKRTILGYVASFSPDGTHLAVGVDGTTVRIYETLHWQVLSIIQKPEKGPSSFTFSPNGKVIATYSGRQIMLWDIKSGELIRTFEDPRRKVSALSFSPDGKILISGTRKCGLRAWDVEAGACLSVLEHEDGTRDPWSALGARCGPPAFEVSFGDGGGKVALAFPNGTVKIWNVKWSRGM